MSDYEELVRQVVREAAVGAFDQHAKIHVGGGKYGKVVSPWFMDVIEAIATRVASQLASAAPVPLTSDEVAQLRHRLKDWRVTYETSALLVERLLDGASAAPAHACNINLVSSRMCERGTKSCIVEHGASPVLSAEERLAIEQCRTGHPYIADHLRSALDRLLGASR